MTWRDYNRKLWKLDVAQTGGLANANGSDRIYAAVKCNKRNLQDYDLHSTLTYYALDTTETDLVQI